MGMHDLVKKKASMILSYLEGLGVAADENVVIAFTHKSFAYDYPGFTDYNERLEFVGDSVLGAIIAAHLYSQYDYPESQLTLMKISLVREEALAERARDIMLGDMIILGNGEERAGGRKKDKILADCMEAIIGYVFLTSGYGACRDFVLKYVYKNIQDINATKNYKTIYQEYVQKQWKVTPTYVDEPYEFDGKNNVLAYKSTVFVNGSSQGEGYGSNKKKAQEEAAKNAYTRDILDNLL